jgi:hypothetical protein
MSLVSRLGTKCLMCHSVMRIGYMVGSKAEKGGIAKDGKWENGDLNKMLIYPKRRKDGPRSCLCGCP